jgi:hypothetical protein
MKTRPFRITAVVASILLCIAGSSVASPPGSTAGLFLKVILSVSQKTAEADWFPAQKGWPVAYGDMVRTGEKSLAIIRFTDKSLVKVREKSELTVSGDVGKKNVSLRGGVIGFNIQKQQANEEFQFSSPTSVASIRGTGGQFTSGSSSDTLIVVEGTVLLSNTVSNRSMEVGAGYTGISGADGNLEVRPSTPAERAAGEAAASASEEQKSLEFDLKDSQDGRRKLKIEFKEK